MSEIRLQVLHPGEGWILDRISWEFITNTKLTIVKNIEEANIAWDIGTNLITDRKIPVIRSKQHIVPSKLDIEKLKKIDEHTTAWHVPCKKTYNQLKEFLPYSTTPIYRSPYWINRDIFFRETYAQDLMRLSNDFTIGSFQRDSEGHDPRLPKLEKGPDIFVEWAKKYNQRTKIHVLLTDPRKRIYIQRRLEEEGIPCTSIFGIKDIHQVASLYLQCDLYIVSSRYEGGPQAILEAAAMKTPIVSRDVGIAAEILHPECIINDLTPFIPSQEHIDYAYDRVKQLDMPSGIRSMEQVIQEVYESFNNGR